MTSLRPTKFFLPPVPDGFVARPQLFEILHAALSCRLTLVSAPAGAGKTTLVSAWAGSVRKQGAAIGWCSLDSSDNSPVRFREYLVACLEEGGSVLDPGVPPPRPGGHAQGRDVLDGLIRGLANQEREIVLILDDYHHIENSQVHAALDFLLDYAPPCLHLILLTRSDPPLQLARLRVAGQLTELRMEQLRFTVPEAAAFLGRAGVSLSLAERRLDPLPPDERDRIAGHIAAVRAYLAWVHGNRTEAVEQAETAAHLLPAEEIALRALNLTTLGNALTQYAADPAAVEVLERAVVLARPVEQPHVYMLAASALAYAHIRLGRLCRAHAVCQDAIEIAETHHLRAGRPLTAAACVYAEWAAVLSEWGQTGPALQAARKGLALSELWGQADTIAVCLLNLINALSLAHDVKAAAEALYRVRKLAHQVSPWFVLNADQLEVEFWLDRGDLAQAARAARQAAGPLPLWLEAHLLMKQNRLDQALSLLERTRSPEAEPLSRETMRIAVVRSLALFHQGDQGGALVALRSALELAQAENWVTLFVRQGEPMEKLLHLARARSIAPEFTGRLLAAFEAHRKPGPAPAAEPLLEPLSRRELEILALLNGPLATPEIAGQLILSVNTVRTHIKSIYGKLGAHGRSGAVKRAQELGLLP